VATAASTCPASVTSAFANVAPMSLASAWPRASSRSTRTTLAPPAIRRRAVAAPSPDAPPVMRATDPLSFISRDHTAIAAQRTTRAASHVVAQRAEEAVQAEVLEDHDRVHVGVEEHQLGALGALDPGHLLLVVLAVAHQAEVAALGREHLAGAV